MKPKRLVKFILWTAIFTLAIYFYVDNAVAYLFGYRNERFGATFFTNQFWFVTHIAGATCTLFLGPIQFWKVIRTGFIGYHRLAGKIYIAGSLVAGLSALRLSLINDCIGCRFSLFILSVLFLLSTSMAWYSIKQKNIKAHQQFMVRSYTCALAFVFVRLDQLIPMDFIFGVIENPDTKRTVIEWIFSFIPLIAVEVFMIWLPSLRQKEIIRY